MTSTAVDRAAKHRAHRAFADRRYQDRLEALPNEADDVATGRDDEILKKALTYGTFAGLLFIATHDNPYACGAGNKWTTARFQAGVSEREAYDALVRLAHRTKHPITRALCDVSRYYPRPPA